MVLALTRQPHKNRFLDCPSVLLVHVVESLVKFEVRTLISKEEGEFILGDHQGLIVPIPVVVVPYCLARVDYYYSEWD